MKQQRDAFLRAVLAWNRVHRIIGREGDFLERVKESEEALENLIEQVGPDQGLVDIGAGSGLLGMPWVWMSPSSRICFVEPDFKKSSFLMAYIGDQKLASRASVVSKPFETVSRETIDQACPGQKVFVARAFAGAKDLAQVVKESAFSGEKFFLFEKPASASPSKAILKRLAI